MAAAGEAWKKYLRFLPEAKWGIIALDFPGCGESTPYPAYKVRKFLSDIEPQDAELALKKTIEMSGPDNKISIFGVSRGAVAALTLTQKHNEIDKVIADSPFCSFQIIKSHFRRIAKIYAPQTIINLIPDFFIHIHVVFAFSVAGLINKCTFIKLSSVVKKRVAANVFVINGSKDKLATSDQTTALLQHNNQKWRHIEIAGAKHNASVLKDPKVYQDSIIDFLEN